MDKLTRGMTIAIPLKSGFAMIMIGQQELTCIIGLAPRLCTPSMTEIRLSEEYKEKLTRTLASTDRQFSPERKPVLMREMLSGLYAEILAKFPFKNDTYPDIDMLAKELLEEIKKQST